MSQKAKSQFFLRRISFYEEKLDELLDETDIDSCFCHNIVDIFQPHHRLVQVSRGSNKKSFANKLFKFCDLETQQRYNIQEEVNISERELTSLVNSLRDFLKKFEIASKCSQIQFPKPKFEI